MDKMIHSKCIKSNKMAIFVMIVVSMLAEWAGVVMNEAPENAGGDRCINRAVQLICGAADLKLI